MTKITIAIDGFSSTGKSTVAKQLAKALGYVYVDSGAMYRAVTLYAMQNGYIDSAYFDKESLIAQLDQISISFKFNENLGFAEVYLNGKNIEKQIRTLEVSQFVSQVATVSEVREQLVKQQQNFGKNKGVVMDGRDIGTVVFPYAELKLFMTASAEKRAQRRYDELIKRGDDVSYDEVLKNVQSRDHIDSTREDSPLTIAEGSIKLDNSNMTLEEQFEFVLKHSDEKIRDVKE
ncbi:(d)CMP kinase [Psychroserpens burtonensis]|uniref:Cytidylate kinase n=1 Tax=Psychroserpens burtonensis TaxID=49278 RepID=A0A5C7BCM8_9FLAO|nr:(d)CMP kinase [Psychroserpens burtonensis]TXE19575.1 (d)CMP kinase [Psychroserpens burtonensis]